MGARWEKERSTTDFLEVDGWRLRYGVHGSGTPLLLIMGLGGHLGLWRPFQQALGDFKTIAFDAPGSGGSAIPILPLAVSQVARLTGHLIDALGYSSLDVLGVSLGGVIAQELARQAPHRVRRLVLAATTCGIGSFPGSPLAVLAMTNLMLFPYLPYGRGRFEDLAASTFGGRLRHEPRLARRVAAQWLEQPPTSWGFLSQVSALWGWSSLPWLHLISQPTLVLSGDDDPIVPLANSRLLASRIPQARLHVLPGGHLVLAEQTDVVAELVREFLRQKGA